MKSLPNRPESNSVAGEVVVCILLVLAVCAMWHGIAGGGW